MEHGCPHGTLRTTARSHTADAPVSREIKLLLFPSTSQRYCDPNLTVLGHIRGRALRVVEILL